MSTSLCKYPHLSYLVAIYYR